MELPSGSSPEPEFVPREPRSNPNISDRPPLKEFAIVASIVLGICFVAYWLLGGLAGWAATRLPSSFEMRLGESLRVLDKLDQRNSPERDRLQALIEDLAQHAPPSELPLRVHLIGTSQVNAVALPGGHILVFQGLLDEAQSENEIAMILGHELGHVLHRDHLRALGRRMVLATILVGIGGDGLATRILEGGLSTLDLRFSREQERAADRLGLELLQAHYGHVGGATDFFQRQVELPQPPELFSTHPHARERVRELQRLAAERGAGQEALKPW